MFVQGGVADIGVGFPCVILGCWKGPFFLRHKVKLNFLVTGDRDFLGPCHREYLAVLICNTDFGMFV